MLAQASHHGLMLETTDEAAVYGCARSLNPIEASGQSMAVMTVLSGVEATASEKDIPSTGVEAALLLQRPSSRIRKAQEQRSWPQAFTRPGSRAQGAQASEGRRLSSSSAQALLSAEVRSARPRRRPATCQVCPALHASQACIGCSCPKRVKGDNLIASQAKSRGVLRQALMAPSHLSGRAVPCIHVTLRIG